MECSVGPRTVMVNVKGALVSRDVLVVFGQWDMGTMQHMISGDGLPWNDPLAPIPQNRPAGFLACRQQIKNFTYCVDV